MTGAGTLRPGVCIRGRVLSEVGLGQAARNLGLAIEAAGIEVTYIDLPLPGRDNAKEFSGTLCKTCTQRTTLHVLSAVRLNSNALHRSVTRSSGHKNIAYPFWELADVPAEWLENIERFDEIWAPSQFIADAFRRSTSLPVVFMPQPTPTPDVVEARAPTAGQFIVLTYLDVDSFVQRKNLTGALNAFLQAFPDPSQSIEFWVKIRGVNDKGLRQSLKEVARQCPRIRVIDETISRAGMNALLMQCDILLSLHRSEGFGLGAAEALAFGKAVVATDYSGTKDFINAETAYPVAFKMIEVGRGNYVEGTEGQSWADPSIDDAAKQLVLAHADVCNGRSRGRQGRKFIDSQHSPVAVGRRIAERLTQIWS